MTFKLAFRRTRHQLVVRSGKAPPGSSDISKLRFRPGGTEQALMYSLATRPSAVICVEGLGNVVFWRVVVDSSGECQKSLMMDR